MNKSTSAHSFYFLSNIFQEKQEDNKFPNVLLSAFFNNSNMNHLFSVQIGALYVLWGFLCKLKLLRNRRQ